MATTVLTGRQCVLAFNLTPDADVRAQFIGPVTQEVIQKFIDLLAVSVETFPKRGGRKRSRQALTALATPEVGA